MFKAVAAERPYPETGLNTASWRAVAVHQVPIRALTATRGDLKISALAPGLTSTSGDPLVHVVKWQGEHYLEDGHHRVVREAIAGSTLVVARVLDLDATSGVPAEVVLADRFAHLRAPDSDRVEPGMVWVRGKGYRSPHLARALDGAAHGGRVDWHDWSPGTEDAHKPLQYRDAG